MPSPIGVIVFASLAGIITILGSCYDWDWYWKWGGKVLEDRIGHHYLRRLHFVLGLIYIAVAVGTFSHAYLSPNIVYAGLLGIIIAGIVGKAIYNFSHADFSNSKIKNKADSK